jgi:hypothetical protein
MSRVPAQQTQSPEFKPQYSGTAEWERKREREREREKALKVKM